MMDKISPQNKTSLKWKKNGDLSEIDMLRILEVLTSTNLNSCDLTCKI